MIADERFSAADLPDARTALGHLGSWLRARLGGAFPVAVGHRVVHGGAGLRHACGRLTTTCIAKLRSPCPAGAAAPAEQPRCRSGRSAAMQPDVLQVACFDTAFHRGHPEVADRFAIPEQLYQEGVRRYGFHGLSYEYIARALPDRGARDCPVAASWWRISAAAPACARSATAGSIDSTHGLHGPRRPAHGNAPRPARSPACILHLLTHTRHDRAGCHPAHALSRLRAEGAVRHQQRRARPARQRRSPRQARRDGLLRLPASPQAAGLPGGGALEGLDAVVFTAGIGENAPAIRAADLSKRRAGSASSSSSSASSAWHAPGSWWPARSRWSGDDIHRNGILRHRTPADLARSIDHSIGLLVDDAMITVEMMITKLEEG